MMFMKFLFFVCVLETVIFPYIPAGGWYVCGSQEIFNPALVFIFLSVLFYNSKCFHLFNNVTV